MALRRNESNLSIVYGSFSHAPPCDLKRAFVSFADYCPVYLGSCRLLLLLLLLLLVLLCTTAVMTIVITVITIIFVFDFVHQLYCHHLLLKGPSAKLIARIRIKLCSEATQLPNLFTLQEFRV